MDAVFSDSYVVGPASGARCEARYAADVGPLGSLISCVDEIADVQGLLATGGDVAALITSTGAPIVAPVLQQVLNAAGSLLGLSGTPGGNGLGTLAPALMQPSITVTVTWEFRGPLDGLVGVEQPVEMTRTATARRHFKNLVVLPTIPTTGDQIGAINDPLGLTRALLTGLGLGSIATVLLGGLQEVINPSAPPGSPIDLNEPLAVATDDVFDLIDVLDAELVGPVLAGLGLPAACADIVPSLTGDLRDIVNPGGSPAPSAVDVIIAAQEDAEPVLLLQVPNNPLGQFGIPFLQFVPTCIREIPDNNGDGNPELEGVVLDTLNPEAQGPISDVGTCALGAPGMFRARLVQ